MKVGSPSVFLSTVASACFAAAAGAVFDLSLLDIVACAALAGLMATIAACDLQRLQVPDVPALLTALAGLFFLWLKTSQAGASIVDAALTAGFQIALCGGALLLVREGYYRLQGRDGLGLGDVKLAAASGAWIGWDDFAFALLLASVLALAFVGFSTVANGGWLGERKIPLAAFLAPAIWVVWFVSRLW